MDGLTTYFSKHTGRMNYAHRPGRGVRIGSGMVEFAALLLIGRRLKQTGARWKVERPGDGRIVLADLQFVLASLLGCA